MEVWERRFDASRIKVAERKRWSKTDPEDCSPSWSNKCKANVSIGFHCWWLAWEVHERSRENNEFGERTVIVLGAVGDDGG